jgi:hypothetical protein
VCPTVLSKCEHCPSQDHAIIIITHSTNILEGTHKNGDLGDQLVIVDNGIFSTWTRAIQMPTTGDLVECGDGSTSA